VGKTVRLGDGVWLTEWVSEWLPPLDGVSVRLCVPFKVHVEVVEKVRVPVAVYLVEAVAVVRVGVRVQVCVGLSVDVGERVSDPD